MTCNLVLVITIIGQPFTAFRTYTGNLVSINKSTYTVDFSYEVPWMTKPLDVPKVLCEKAD